MTKFDDLNSTQQEIVQNTEGAYLVSAGAGSGKTRVLTNRVCYLIDKGVSPENILAITFTNKATKEMQERVTRMTDGKAFGLTIKTFHSFCAGILREFIYKFDGFDKNFSVYDDSNQKALLKKVINDLKVSDDIAKKCEYHISSAKNLGLDPDEYLKDNRYEPNIDTIVSVYREYQTQLKNNNALDFDDLLLKTLELFHDFPSILEYFQEKYKYIHVDEFQDTNLVQYKILYMLGIKYKNLFVVGDEDQCIYTWRGANITNIKMFIEDFKPKVYKLEQNYRSTKNIISRANLLIKNNISRIDKTLFTENDDGDEVSFKECYDEKEEAEYVANQVYLLKSRGVDPREIGILMRISSLSRNIEEKLLNYNIPYVTSGIFKFFDRLEVKNVLAYLSMVVNPKDNANVIRIINVPKRGIGQTTIDKLESISRETGSPLTEIIENFRELDVSATIKNKIADFGNLIVKFNEEYKKKSMSDFAEFVINEAGLKDMYNSKSEDDLDRKLNIEQLISSIKDYEYENENATLIDYLESVTLQSSLEKKDDNEPSVSISTIHASKGLEFDYVFLIGLEEGKFPLSRALDNADELEEERRLMYVGITRAKKKLYITRAKSRFLYGRREDTICSRFIEEMGIKVPKRQFGGFSSDYDDFVSNDYYSNNYKSNYNAHSNYSNGYSNNYGKSSFGNNLSKSNYSFDSSYSTKKQEFGGSSNNLNKLQSMNSKVSSSKKFDDFKVGVQVFHTKFGVGTIIKREDAEGNNYVSVDFGKIGVKTLSLNFAPLQILKK